MGLAPRSAGVSSGGRVRPEKFQRAYNALLAQNEPFTPALIWLRKVDRNVARLPPLDASLQLPTSGRLAQST